jgi:hypothetical protein
MSISFDFTDGQQTLWVDGRAISNATRLAIEQDVDALPRVVVELSPALFESTLDEYRLELRLADRAATAVDLLSQIDSADIERVMELAMDMSTSPTQAVINAIIEVLTAGE